MLRIRPFERADIPLVAALRQRSFRQTAHPAAGSAEQYFARVFFESPVSDAGIPSLVCESADGRIVGFVGRIVRAAAIGGEAIRLVAPTQLCVEREGGSLYALRLLGSILDGPQDLAWADMATDRVRALWLRLGGQVARTQSLHWRAEIRPSQSVLRGVSGGLATRGVRFASRFLLRDADAATLRALEEQAQPLLAEMEPSMTTLASTLAAVGRTLALTWDVAHLSWIMEQLAEKFPRRPVRSAVLQHPDGRMAGSYVYAGTDGHAEVALLRAQPGSARAVLAHLLVSARADGHAVVRGRMEPGLLDELPERGIALFREPPWTLFHSRRADITAAIHAGATDLSRLDGEWWLNF